MSLLAIIAGSGAGFFSADGAEDAVAQTRWGQPSAALVRWQQSGHTIVLLRRHGAAGNIPPHLINYRANIACLAALKPDYVIATNAVGGIRADAAPGNLVVPDQLIDYTWGRAHSFYEGGEEPTEYAEFTHPYDPELRQHLLAAAAQAATPCVADGVYGVTQGPRLETQAEIDRLERDGCAVVGMTSMPEAGLAREAGLRYASCCSVVNYAAGRSDQPIHAEIESFLRQGMQNTARLVSSLVATL